MRVEIYAACFGEWVVGVDKTAFAAFEVVFCQRVWDAAEAEF